jgi:hypothetical protein
MTGQIIAAVIFLTIYGAAWLYQRRQEAPV